MDLLAKRYASPFFLMDEYLKRGKLKSYIDTLDEILADEKIYELWLNLETGQTYNDFKESLLPSKAPIVNEVDKTELIKHSFEVLSSIEE